MGAHFISHGQIVAESKHAQIAVKGAAEKREEAKAEKYAARRRGAIGSAGRRAQARVLYSIWRLYVCPAKRKHRAALRFSPKI